MPAHNAVAAARRISNQNCLSRKTARVFSLRFFSRALRNKQYACRRMALPRRRGRPTSPPRRRSGLLRRRRRRCSTSGRPTRPSCASCTRNTRTSCSRASASPPSTMTWCAFAFLGCCFCCVMPQKVWFVQLFVVCGCLLVVCCLLMSAASWPPLTPYHLSSLQFSSSSTRS